MRICVYGAGAIGGYMAVRLAEGGNEVSVVARGAHLEAIREDGLKLESVDGDAVAEVAASDDPAELGEQDAVIVAVKAPAVADIAPRMAPLLGADTIIVTAMNGVPHWYFHGIEGPLAGTRLACLDPEGVIAAGLPPERCIGAVVYPAAELVAPGLVRHTYSNRFQIGEPDGSRSDRITALHEAMAAGGLRAPIRPDIRKDIWIKLWGNVSLNPVSALTGATLDLLVNDPGTQAIVRAMMTEAHAIAEALGVTFPIDVEKRLDGVREVGAHKTSMLQDLEAGRRMEIDALVTAVIELAELVGVEVPTIRIIHGLVVQRARLAGCY
jgi:2-dehydropantoate 2-reductase